MTEPNLDALRKEALDRVDSSRTFFFWMVNLTMLVEVGFLGLVWWLTDWSDPLHQLMVAIAGLIYLTLGVALLALGAFVNFCTRRVLLAVTEA